MPAMLAFWGPGSYEDSDLQGQEYQRLKDLGILQRETERERSHRTSFSELEVVDGNAANSAKIKLRQLPELEMSAQTTACNPQ